MDPEFIRVLLRVVAVGLTIGGVCAGVLVIAYRAFGTDKPRDFRGSLWVAVLLALVIIGCMILLRFSLVRY